MPKDNLIDLTEAQRRRWGARAVTLHIKASDLFTEIQEALGPDHHLTAAIGGIMCEAAAFANIAKRRNGHG